MVRRIRIRARSKEPQRTQQSRRRNVTSRRKRNKSDPLGVRGTHAPRAHRLTVSQTTLRTLHSSVFVGLASTALVGSTLAMGAHVLVQPPTFYLCEANVADISTRRSDERFLVTVRLTDVGTEQWVAFTTEHITDQVHVNVGSVLLIKRRSECPSRPASLRLLVSTARQRKTCGRPSGACSARC